jgi:hypothetical protein
MSKASSAPGAETKKGQTINRVTTSANYRNKIVVPMEGSSAAVFALLLWVPISVAAFRFLRPVRAATLLLLGAVMFLPEREEFRIPAIPPLNKLTICALCVFVGILFTSRRRLTKIRWPRAMAILVALFGVGVVGSIATNLEPVRCGIGFCEALLPHTTITFWIDFFLSLLIPFWIGMISFRSRAGLRSLLSMVVGAGLIYSLLVIVEARLSPQLHAWVYGYIQHSWFQTLRAGGYRPMVFMAHGLAVALFMASCAVAAMGFVKARLKLFRLKAVVIAAYLLIILVICRSFGALIYGAACFALIALTSARTQVRVALLACMISIGYPILRAVDLFPTQQFVELASYYNTERGASLGFRFFNEDMLLEKALLRPIFGWGGFDRIRIFDERSGEDVSVTDGYWIILLSSRGVVGFTAVFGLLILPVALAYRRIHRIPGESARNLLSCLTLIATINIVDLIPNGLFTYFPLFFSGALLGVVQGLAADRAPERARRRAIAHALQTESDGGLPASGAAAQLMARGDTSS